MVLAFGEANCDMRDLTLVTISTGGACVRTTTDSLRAGPGELLAQV